MCRFLLVRSKTKIKLEKLLHQFSQMSERSRAPDGDWQGDGWGIAIKTQSWKIYKSLNPIWEDKDTFNIFPETNIFVVHARSAGFPQDRGIIEYNEPYVSDDLCFVFNGMLKGVNIARQLEGKIGAQKIFSLIQNVILSECSELKDPPRIEEVLRIVDQLIVNNSKKVIGMNIGLVKDDKFNVLCEYDNNDEYFSLRYYQDDQVSLVCSEEIGEYDWKMMKKGEILVL
ncbi:hypothetical protein HY029_03150 [Candidatus Gottesmanbacteria bacterium]|nr:hypothetical protein [Candidatus Gottesmanbacteria bacterium]